MPEHAGAHRTGPAIPRRNLGPAFAASLAWHGLVAALAVIALRQFESGAGNGAPTIVPASAGIVWLQQAGRGGGGGGGGNRMTDPPRRAEAPGRDALTVRVARALSLQPERAATPDPLEGLDIPAQRLASGLDSLPGAAQAAPGPPTASLGPGREGGAGDGTRGGEGPGDGRGLGDGSERNTGGRVYGLGDGVDPPVALYRGTPVYTPEAMRARIEGTVVVACVVQPSGVCTDIKVTRSLDAAFGLDREAVKAAARWRFRPGTKAGRAVPILVTIEIGFSIR